MQKVERSVWSTGGVPDYVTMYVYVPDKLAPKPPILVASHHCAQTSGIFGSAGSGAATARGAAGSFPNDISAAPIGMNASSQELAAPRPSSSSGCSLTTRTAGNTNVRSSGFLLTALGLLVWRRRLRRANTGVLLICVTLALASCSSADPTGSTASGANGGMGAGSSASYATAVPTQSAGSPVAGNQSGSALGVSNAPVAAGLTGAGSGGVGASGAATAGRPSSPAAAPGGIAGTSSTGAPGTQPSAAGAPAADRDAGGAPAAAESAPGIPQGASKSDGCGKVNPKVGSAQSPLEISNHRYYVKLPTSYDPDTPYPTLFVFHPTNNPLDWAEKNAGFESNEAKERAVRIYPGAGNNSAGWGASDVAFFGPLYSEVTKNFCLDTSRMFAMGESSGGDFSSILGCEFADKLRGVAPCASKPVNGYPLDATKRSCKGKVASVVIHGKNDMVVGPANGPATRDFYVAVNGCNTMSKPVDGYTDAMSNCVEYQGCAQGYPVYFCQHSDPEYSGTNHGWPHFAATFLWRLFSSY